MSEIILSINAGSSSVKVSVFTPADAPAVVKSLADIQISGLTALPAKLTYSRGDEQIKDKELPEIKDIQEAYDHIIKHLIEDEGLTEIKHTDDITYACHRVVHGGDFDKPVRIDKDTYHHLEALSDLAPLHNARALEIIKAVYDRSPKITNIAFFDSAFHATIPAAAHTYAISPSIAQKNKLRKYGFHGLSYSYIHRASTKHLRKLSKECNIIALHLGSGASVCCIKGGKSLDTSMGLTPLAGLPGATRSGDVDPSLVFHMTHDAGRLSNSSTSDVHITQAEQILNKESGWKALTGTTDFGEIVEKAEQGDEACKLAFDIFVDRIVGYIGAYFVKLSGELDAVVFAGGIGENSWKLREAIMMKIKFLNFIPNKALNEKGLGEKPIVEVGYDSGEYRLLVCRTDEQQEMARQCVELGDDVKKA